MKVQKTTAAIILGIVLLTALACGPRDGQVATPTPVSGETAEQVRDQALIALGQVDTCRFDMGMTIDMAMSMEGETVNMVLATDTVGALDTPGEKMYMDMDMVMGIPDVHEIDLSMEVYVVDDWDYRAMSMFGQPPSWIRTPMQSGDWEKMDITSQHLDLLLDVQVKLVGTDTLDGTECYTLELTPDLEQLWKLLSFGGAEQALPPGLDLEELASDLSLKQWIAKDTYSTRKTVMTFTLELTPESLGIEAEADGDFDATADVAMVITLHHINEPVTIALPPEAAEAEVAELP